MAGRFSTSADPTASLDLANTVSTLGLDPIEVQRSNQEVLSQARDEQILQRKTYSTARDGQQRVKSLGKIVSGVMTKGGQSIIAGEISPTDFLPSQRGNTESKMPDYYRNGRQVEVPNPDGVGTIRQFAPVPEQVDANSDSYTGVIASIRLIDPKRVASSNTPQTSPRSGSLIPEFSKFFLESVQEAHQEKYQIVETFNDWYVYFYGERPPVYNFSGHLLNLSNYNWKNEFMYFYQNFWRGTKATELGARVYITYDYQQIQGYILNVGTNVNALTDKAAPFNFSILVTKRLIFNGPDTNDSIVRDNLLPKSATGLINSEANSFSQALTKQYLEDGEAAARSAIVNSNTQAASERTLKKSAASAPKNPAPNQGGLNLNSIKTFATQRASAITNKLKGFFS